jgi:transposase
MTIIWHLLSDPRSRYRDLGPDWHTRHISRDRKIRTHLQGLQAMGLTVTITSDTPAEAA